MLSLKIFKKITILLIVGFSFVGFVYGAGTVTGRVIDQDGNPLAFANVVITHKIVNGQEVALRSQIGTVTDINGDYVLSGVQEGSYKLDVIYLGYTSNSASVDVPVDGTVRHNVTMENKTLDLEEVVVTMQAKGQMAAINQQLSANAIKNVVAADRIRQNPDANAAEAIGRLPGISVTRSGGEASDIIIRGMAPQYNTVLINGIEVPSNKGTSRNAGLGGISQFSLQGVEVFKSITPDMDANTVSGAVNMRLKTAASGFHGSVMAQSGYNAQNNDFGNYKFNVNLSNRFLDDKLGIDGNVSIEKTNRSTQTLSTSYEIETNDALPGEYEPMYVNSVNLNDITNLKQRGSGSLVIDYRFSPKSKIEFSNFYSTSPTDVYTINKSHNISSGNVGYGINRNKGGYSKLYTGALIGEHTLGILKIDYTLAYSQSDKKDDIRNYSVNNPNGYDQGFGTRENRSLPLEDIVNAANDEETQANLREFGMGGPGNWKKDNLQEKQYDARLNFTVPIRIGNVISGNLKAGGQFRRKDRARDYDEWVYGGPPFHKLVSGIQQTPPIDWHLPWVILNDRNHVSMENMVGGHKGDFLQGGFNFGWYPDINRMNEIFDWWQNITTYYRVQGQNVWEPIFGQDRMMGWLQPRPSVANDNHVQEDYSAGYFMGEFNIGNMIHFIPGVRYEHTYADLQGWFLERDLNEGLVIPGEETYATRKNDFILPMAHLKIKPLDWLNLQFSFTKTLHRPNFNLIVPFEYVDDAVKDYQYEFGDPQLKPEEWNNFDVMVAFHNSKIGLLALNGFYKTVENKIWERTWYRIGSDEPVPHFPVDEEVYVTGHYNNNEPTYVRGFEIEWQTNFWYLPKPFSYFTLTTNYSYLNNEAVYPYSEVSIEQVGETDRGRPIYEKVRSDSTFTGPMLNQANHLANVSLGFNYKFLDIWVSYQYIGEITTAIAVQEEKDKYKSPFQRWGVQTRIELPVKGLEVLFNVANINDIQEAQYYKGDDRLANLENYGWTADFGVRYTF